TYSTASITSRTKLTTSNPLCETPNRTITSFFDGITITYCSSNPSAQKASAGSSGYFLFDGSLGSPALSHQCAPYRPMSAAGAGVVVYLTQPSGSIRSPFHMPSFKYKSPNLAQSRAEANA